MKSNALSTGLVMFTVFFGAGNVVFPLALGQYAQDQNIYAIFGLLLSAVGVPFLGMFAMTLYNGEHKPFFATIGSIPGFIVTAIILALIGPFGAIPRCIALSYGTAKMYLPGVSLEIFSFVSCVLIFLLTFRKSRFIDIMGLYLTPILIGSLAIIILKGVIWSPSAPISQVGSFDTFLTGLKEGYQTMDLLGAFFFSSIVIGCLKKGLSKDQSLIKESLKACTIGGILLSLSYIGFSYVAAFFSENLSASSKDELPALVALEVLGPYMGIIASVAVALACLTTAMALALVFAEFIEEDLSSKRISYPVALAITLVVAGWITTLSFNGIVAILGPILQMCYPALIVLTICNILKKLYGFQWIKLPCVITLLVTIGFVIS